MKKLRKTIELYAWYARIRLQRNMAYRADFIIGLVITVLNAAGGPVFQFVLFTNTKGYPGWNLTQVILFQGMALIFAGIRGMLFGNVFANVTTMSWRGDFDRLLILPHKPIKLLLSSGFDLGSIGILLTGLCLTVGAGIKLNVTVNALDILLVLAGIFCGLLLYMAFLIFYCTLLIMVTRNDRIEEIINALFSFSGYPLEIFPRVMSVVLSTVLPFMVIAYFPSQVLLGRATASIVPGMLACFALFGLSLWLWNLKLKRYTSVGG